MIVSERTIGSDIKLVQRGHGTQECFCVLRTHIRLKNTAGDLRVFTTLRENTTHETRDNRDCSILIKYVKHNPALKC